MRKLKLDELNRLSLEDMEAAPKLPLVVVLDNIRSAYNVGSIFRTADAFRIEGIYLCGITATPPHKEIFKTAIGATKTVNWFYNESIKNCIITLKSESYHIIGIEQTTHSVDLRDININANTKVAIVMGNEVDGISEGVLPLLDQVIEIEQYGTKHSLNVSVCSGIVMWEISSQLRNHLK